MISISGEECKLGLYIYPGEGWMGGDTARWNDLKAMAQIAENMGFDSIWLPDRLQFSQRTGQMGLRECTTILSALAAVTTRVEIGNAVIRSIYRNPALVAKMADSIDEISGGRFILGIGAGGNEGDNHAFGYPIDHSVSRFEEAITIVHGLLRNGFIDFEGAYYQARIESIEPRGPRPNGPPILVAARGPRMMRLAARYADMWNVPILPPTPEELGPVKQALDAACVEVGRDPSTLTKIAGLLVNPIPGFDDHPYGASLSGTPDKTAEAIRRYAIAGYSHVVLWVYPNSPEGVERLAPVLAEFN